MAGTQTTLSLQDRLTGPLTKMMKAMDRTIGIMERMNTATNNVDTRGLQRARADIQSATADLERLRSSSNVPDRLSDGFNRIRSPVENATGSVKRFFASFVGAAAAYLSLQGLANGFKKFITASDSYTSTAARLSLINDGLQTQAELQDKIYNAAQRSLTPYNDMASTVAKLNLLAGDAFSGNDEAIRFSELMGKSFAVSGASTGEQQAGMHQLTQALASGRLQGDEFRSITENAPLLARAIADSVGASMGELKKMSSEGKITGAIIKNALFSAADDIESKFKAMPITFGDAMTLMKNWATTAFEPLLVRFNAFVNSDAFGVLAGHVTWFVNVFVAGMTLMFDIMENVYTEIGAIGSLISQSWDLVGPLIVGVGVALATITGILIVKYAWLGLVRTATLAWAAAQWVVNAAFMANPIGAVILVIVAIIALVIYAMVSWANETAVAVGVIVGVFALLGSYVYNTIATMWNLFSAIAEFLVNVFIDPTYAVQKLIYDMSKSSIDIMGALAGSFDSAANVLAKVFVTAANVAITAVNGISKAIKNITGIDLGEAEKLKVEATTSFLSNGLKDMAANLKAPTSSKSVVSIPKMKMMSMPAAYNAGNDFGKKMSLGASDKLTSGINKLTGIFKGGNAKANPFSAGAIPVNLDVPTGLGGKGLDDKTKNPTGGKLDKIGKIDDDINIADEDLKMLRDMADIRSIHNFRTLNPTVNFTGDMTIREDADITKIIKGIETYMRDEMDRSGEGVYA